MAVRLGEKGCTRKATWQLYCRCTGAHARHALLARDQHMGGGQECEGRVTYRSKFARVRDDS
jgi:hypothetical protein